MTGVASQNSLPKRVAQAPQVGTTINIPMLVAATEATYELPKGTNKFTIKLRSTTATLQLYIGGEGESGASSTTYIQVEAGSNYYDENLNTIIGTTLYFQSPSSSQVAEIVVWQNLSC